MFLPKKNNDPLIRKYAKFSKLYNFINNIIINNQNKIIFLLL